MHIIMQTIKIDYGRKFEAWYWSEEQAAHTNFSGMRGCWPCKCKKCHKPSVADSCALLPTSSTGLPPKHRSGLSALQPQLCPTHSQMQKASRAQSCCAATANAEGLRCKVAGALHQERAAGLRCAQVTENQRFLQNDSLLLLAPHRLQEVTGAAYASDSSPPSCMVPSSSDTSFRSMNFPSFVNGTDFISWANASGSWRKREVSKLQQPLRNTHFPVLLAKVLQLWGFFIFFKTTFRIKIWNINNTFWITKDTC